MDQYKYKKVEFTYKSEDEKPTDIITEMNKHGIDGWEVINIIEKDKSIEKKGKKIIRIHYQLFMKKKY